MQDTRKKERKIIRKNKWQVKKNHQEKPGKGQTKALIKKISP